MWFVWLSRLVSIEPFLGRGNGTYLGFQILFYPDFQKQEGVGPVDKRDLHWLASPHCPQKGRKYKDNNCDMWHMICDMGWVVNIISKFHLPSSYGLGAMMFWRLWRKGWITQSVN